MTDPALTRADTELERLENALTAMAANLVELDENPDRKELGATALTGRTATAWADAEDALARLWQGHRQLGEVIAQARALRGQRRVDAQAYTRLVLGGSITLSTSTVPLAQRGLLGAGQVSTVCSPADLLAVMESAFATAVDVVATAGERWRTLLPGAADAAAALAHARALSGSALLDDADRLLTAFTGALASDPLSADPSVLARARELIARADAERTSASELRAWLEQRLRDARQLCAEIETAARAADAARSAAAGRFPEHTLSRVRGEDPRTELAGIDALAAAGQWPLIAPRLTTWNRRATERLTALRAAAAHNAGLLAERNELRGRLDAYRAKALRRGLGEDGTLTPLADAARTALYQAPCDLNAARAAVGAYQEALSTTIAARDAR
ncbi:hypothetical protein AMIS_53280 [Actinoplanes missouriensis 431]|uniref:Uncharacterized protein n=1 Tax=Actinoplanes missouriensis (strain ATCC 14538 / DSM 43046 / CBS 188.64 / JCM 3121 / NBRC 102363 / NCIMB 12654 / NRRL B-3342 / UNCC 431) TaxID=512565 RepID=I0HC11_ACTM4|nr:hypothetical protein [Actinoplanes missouriensis]BAL90548.1 hypothetical protein AMIS_53280 [Actinoplanes missouriensis 431]